MPEWPSGLRRTTQVGVFAGSNPASGTLYLLLKYFYSKYTYLLLRLVVDLLGDILSTEALLALPVAFLLLLRFALNTFFLLEASFFL